MGPDPDITPPAFSAPTEMADENGAAEVKCICSDSGGLTSSQNVMKEPHVYI